LECKSTVFVLFLKLQEICTCTARSILLQHLCNSETGALLQTRKDFVYVPGQILPKLFFSPKGFI
jgi:hypothetical protein